MCCAFATLVLLGPRVLDALLWLFWPQFSLAFKNEFLVPLLGIIFLPWTTLMFVLVWTPVGLTPFAWFMVGFGFFFDIMSWLGGGWGNRRRVPGYDDMGLEPAMAPSASGGYYSPVAPAAPAAPAPAVKPPSTTPPSSAPPAPKPPAPPPDSPPPATPTKPS